MKFAIFLSLALHMVVSLAVASKPAPKHPECSEWIEFIQKRKASEGVSRKTLIDYNRFLHSVEMKVHKEYDSLSAQEKNKKLRHHLSALEAQKMDTPEDLFYEQIYLDQVSAEFSDSRIRMDLETSDLYDKKDSELRESLKNHSVYLPSDK